MFRYITTRPTYICLPTGLVHASSGRLVERMGPTQEVTPLAGVHFFDAWRIEPCCEVPTDLPEAQNGPGESKSSSPPASPRTDQAKAREEEARDILARASKNQADDGPSTRKAAIRAYRYLHTMTTQHGALIQHAYLAAKTHAACSKGPIDPKDTAGYHPLPDELPTVPPELTSGLFFLAVNS